MAPNCGSIAQPEILRERIWVARVVDRRLGFMLGIAGLGQLMVAARDIAGESRLVEPATLAVILIPAVLQLLILVSGHLLSDQRLRALWIAYVASFFPTFILWFFVFRPGDRLWPSLWLLHIAGCGYALLLWRLTGAVIYCFAFVATPILASGLVWGYLEPTLVTQAIALCTNLGILLCIGLIRNQMLERATAERRAEISEQAALLAEEKERTETALNRVIHDEILSTLKAAQFYRVETSSGSAGTGDTDMRTAAQQARLAIQELILSSRPSVMSVDKFQAILHDRVIRLNTRV